MTSADTVEKNGGLINALTGTLSKAIDTGLDLLTIRAQGKANAAIGTSYPTGQFNPADAASEQMQEKQVAAVTNTNLKTGLYIGGAIAAVVIIALVVKKY